MKRTGPKRELAALESSIKELRRRFVARHLGPPSLAPPTEDEILDVAAYVVLAHGALENFIEGLALWVVGRAVSNWTTKKKTTRCTTSLLLYQSAPSDSGAIPSVFENIRVALELAKERVSKSVYDNNGVTLAHLRTLFLPLGVTVPTDPLLSASLDLLVKMRHQWAHQYRYGAKVVTSAHDAETTVLDCLKIARRLSAEASTLRP